MRRVVEATEPRREENKKLFYFDWKEALRRVEFIETYCRYPEGPKAGKLMKLDPWQKEEIVYPTFGWKERGSDTGNGDLRRYRRVFVGIPRKNAKSTLIAAMSLSIMLQDGEIRAQLYALASNKDQANCVYRPFKSMVEMEPRLQKLVDVTKNGANYERNGSFMEVLSSTDGKHGLNTHAVLIDELHEFLQPRQVNALEALTSSMLSRSQPLEFVMTTAGYNTGSVCYSEWQYCLKVKRGEVIDDLLLPVIYAADEGDDWHDPKVWAKANPGLGSILTLKNFKIEYMKAVNDPRKLNTFLRLHLNIWTHAEERWMTDAQWMDAARDVDPEKMKGLPCWVGFDLAATRDLNAMAMLWWDEGADRLYLRVFCWVNREVAVNRDTGGGVDYLDFEREGVLSVTPGNVADHERITMDAMSMMEGHVVSKVAYDRAHASYVVPRLVQEGYECEQFNQRMLDVSLPIKEFDRAVARGKIVHDGSRMMRWQMGCVELARDNSDNVKIIKGNKNRGRVDGVMAAVMAFGQWYHDTLKEDEPDIEVFGLDF